MSAEELLDALDAEGNYLSTKTRPQLHVDCDWHMLVFVWSAWQTENGTQMMLQRRRRKEDAFHHMVDAPAGGHVSAGETHAQGAIRELEEEIGVVVQAEELVYLGFKAFERDVGECRRVLEHFYVLRHPLQIDQLSFSEEAGEFIVVALDDLDSLLNDGGPIPARGRCAEVDEMRDLIVTGEDLAAYPDSILEAFRLSLRAIRRWLADGKVNPADFARD
ncbi:MAG: NUDIX domain-containing protein [Candidatus Latescibacterota bacterium]|nr:NUDIX domain-containing protein [Candidatus Latescibacterota bacterium]